MSRPGWVGHSRFDDVLGADRALGEHELEEEPIDAFLRRQVDHLRAQLHPAPPTDPGLRARLERDLAAAEQALAAATLQGHWASGEGDRRLF